MISESILESGKLPVEELCQLAAREGRRPRPVYGTHKWFARRLGSVFRALLVGASTPKDCSFWDAYSGSADLKDLTILDPFVGGGTSVIEAQRLGASWYAADVDPVAVAVTGFQSRLHRLAKLGPHLELLMESVGQKVKNFHTTVDESGLTREVLHHFWVQVLDCASCSNEISAHPHYQLAHDAELRIQWVFCRYCGEIQKARLNWATFNCNACNRRTEIFSGPARYGKVTCPECSHAENLIDVFERTGHRPVWHLFAIEVLSSNKMKGSIPLSQRAFHKASDIDQTQYKAAKAKLDQLISQDGLGKYIPDQMIPPAGRSDDRPLRYGYRRYSDLFNARQLLHLSLLSQAISGLDDEVREAFSIAFSNHLKSNCMLTHYAFGWRRLAPLFSMRAYRHVTRPVEINPWITGTGRGTFPNSVRAVQQAADWAKAPREYVREGGFVSLPSILPHESAASSVTVATAEKLTHVPDNTVDLVLTDPPYFDNIAYSELSDFFRPWLESLGIIVDCEKGLPRTQLSAHKRDHKSVVKFSDRLGKCFQEIGRKLKHDGRIIFTYQHSSDLGWLALAKALSYSDFRIVRVFPVLGDASIGLHKRRQCINWDAVVIAVLDPSLPTNSALVVAPHAERSAIHELKDWVRRLGGRNSKQFREADRLNFLRACLVGAALGNRSDNNKPKKGVELADILVKAQEIQKQACEDVPA